MATSKIFKKVPTTVPNRSGFNMSYNNFFSSPVGTLVPSHIDFLIPGDEVDLSSKLHVQLPPMATDFYGSIQAKEEAFFVPARILFGGWKDFYVNPVDGTTNPSNIDGQLAKYLIGCKVPSGVISTLTAAVSGWRDINVSYHEYNYQTFLDFEEQLEKILDDFEYLVSQMSNNTFEYLSVDDSSRSKLGAGSLADYLGFKVDLKNGANVFLSSINSNLQSILGYFTSSIAQVRNYYSQFSDINQLSTYSIPRQTFGSDPSPISVQIAFQIDKTSRKVSGYMTLDSNSVSYDININNILSFLAYHKVYDDWYRAPMIQKSLFQRNVANQSASTSVANMPWITSGADSKIYFTNDQLIFANGSSLFDLHQRNWQKDYFTSATPEPQGGEASSVKFDVVDDSGEFTIASLRAANALQQWLEKNNIGGFRYGDMIYAQYGVYPSDAVTDRAIYLGSTSVDVYNKSVYQQSGDGGSDTNNPFNAIGSKYSNPIGVGDGNFCNNYRVTEAGFIIKIFSLVPTAYYSSGVRRMFMYNDISDIAFPVLAGVGDQPIYGYELTDIFTGNGDNTVFGYQQRYSEYKFIDDQVHGLLRDGQSLDSFALQRSFTTLPQLGSDFLEIPRDYLDQVSATSYKLSNYGCWVNCYNHYLKSSTLPAYSIPTLENMKGHTVLVDKGGSYIA